MRGERCIDWDIILFVPPINSYLSVFYGKLISSAVDRNAAVYRDRSFFVGFLLLEPEQNFEVLI